MSTFVRHAIWFCVVVFSSATQSRAEIKDADCLRCHSDKTLTKTTATGKEVSLFVDPAVFATSAHKPVGCADCHDDLTSAHPDDNVVPKPVQCASCHETAGTDYSAGSHGRATAAGVHDAPGCVDCHGGHKMVPINHGGSSRAAVEMCGRCHASERLNTKYNLPADRVRTFSESYHGLASQYGSTVTANCASCHGHHKILPSSDPASMIHKNNLVATCGKCHPGANERFAAGKIHVDVAQANAPDFGGKINWWVRRVYLILILGTVGGMLLHNALLFARKFRARLRTDRSASPAKNGYARTVLRMNRHQRWQHWVLAGSFIALAVTGFALKFPDSWLAILLGSSEPIRRWAHRIAGVVLLGVGLYHLIYLLVSPDGRKLVKDLFPSRQDLNDVWIAMRYLVGLTKQKPRFGRFGYPEKMEYWAVVWGSIIMGVTGLMVWLKLGVTQWLPRWAVDVALTIHYYEAILACLAIIVWHFYHVIFDPDVYPLNLACLDGKVSEHWQREEHPLQEISKSLAAKPPDITIPA